MAVNGPEPDGFRFFSDDSIWNTPVADDAPVHEDSSEMVRANFAEPPGIYVNRVSWSVPVYLVDSSTPRQDVRCIYGKAHGTRPTFDDPSGADWIVHTDYGVLMKDVPIPDDALPDSAIALRPDKNADAHLCVVDLERGLEWDFCWMARAEDGEWTAGQGVMYRTDGDGLIRDYEGSARGSGFPLTGGLIFKREIEAGVIDHALALALHPAGYGHVYPPASCSDGRRPIGAPADGKGWGIPEGALVQLDPELDVDSLGLDHAAKVIARAMQRYGMYVCDNSGSINLYAEVFPFSDPDPWDGVMAVDSPTSIPVERLRVIDWGDRYCEEGEKPHNQDRYRDPHAFGPLPDSMAKDVLHMINFHRGRYDLPPRVIG